MVSFTDYMVYSVEKYSRLYTLRSFVTSAYFGIAIASPVRLKRKPMLSTRYKRAQVGF